MEDPVRVPKALLARLIAAIETPDDLTDEERKELLEDADHHYPYEAVFDDAKWPGEDRFANDAFSGT